jgi:type I restriction enzyme S subunit
MESSGSTVAHLRVGQVYDIPVPVPPNEEIEGIVAFVDKEIEKINRLEKETLKSVELLKEHRTTLISAAVTGKIDVRDLA